MTLSKQSKLSSNAIRTLESRYLWKDSSGKIIETPAELFDRVADFIASAEKKYETKKIEIKSLTKKFNALMTEGMFFPNSPTLMNANRTLGMLSACFVLPIEDSIEGIFESVKQTAQIQKAGGGTGFSFDKLRPTGDHIASSGGRTSGPISFWRVFSEATRAIQQGAFRRGANMGMMSIEHPDILKFITAKSDPLAFENFNISIKITNDFMSKLCSDPNGAHVVTNPHTGKKNFLPYDLDVQSYVIQDLSPIDSPKEKVYTRKGLWNLIVKSAWESGEPGLCFIDRINRDNPTPDLGRIEATNPCGEQPLLDYEACNLGSINIARFVSGGRLDETALRDTIRLAVRFLDNVIDVNNYMIPEIDRICRTNRKIGLGIMGLADAMFELRIKYDSEEGIKFGRHIARMLTEEAFDASEELAKARGTFPNFKGSVWDMQHNRPMRNAAVTTIAPTGTISILAGCSGGIEPVYGLAFYRHILGGQEMLEINSAFKHFAQEKGVWSDTLGPKLAQGVSLNDLIEDDDGTISSLFVTSGTISPMWHIKMQAAFQEYIDGAISKTVNMPANATLQDVEKVFNLAYDLKCKGVTVYRSGCRVGEPMTHEQGVRVCPQCKIPIPDKIGCARCFRCGQVLCGLF